LAAAAGSAPPVGAEEEALPPADSAETSGAEGEASHRTCAETTHPPDRNGPDGAPSYRGKGARSVPSPSSAWS
jgi:hypothetical protein